MEMQLSTIVPIATLEDITLLIKEKDVENPNAKCCQLNISSNKFVFFENIEIPLKFTAFEEVPKESWESCREDIYKRVKDSIIVEILQEFEEEVDELRKAEKLKGGLADNKSIEDIASHHNASIGDLEDEFSIGFKIEAEHTSDRKMAAEIVRDHLWEDPNYYTKLKKVEE